MYIVILAHNINTILMFLVFPGWHSNSETNPTMHAPPPATTFLDVCISDSDIPRLSQNCYHAKPVRVLLDIIITRNTVIRLIFVVKIFSYTENIQIYLTRNFCYNEYFSNEYLEQSTCTYAVHAVFMALRILEGYGWTHVYIIISVGT